MRIQLTKNFYLDEFIPSVVYTRFGESSIWFIDERVPKLMQAIRDHFGKPMTVNNWWNGGDFNNRGFRTPDTTVGGKLSQHRFGRAGDFNMNGITPQEIERELTKHFKKFNAFGLTTIENTDFTPSWVHVDVRTTNSDKILIVKP